MAVKIDTVTARENLKPRHAPYYYKIKAECHIGFRKTTPTSVGTWLARFRDDQGVYQIKSLGSLEQHPSYRRFDAAVALAEPTFAHRQAGGSAVSCTVGEVCQQYADKQRINGKEKTAKELEGRFKRWMTPDKKLSATPVDKLTSAQVKAWRAKLTLLPATLQDKTKTATKPRAKSSINREMAVFKAALNFAVESRHVTSDLAWKYELKTIKNATGRRDCYLDIDQRRALVANAPPDLAAFLRALSLIPLRPGAMALLTAKSFDKRLGVLTVGQDKAGQDRKITLPATTTAFFTEQSTDKLPTAPLLARANGQFWSSDSWKFPFKDAAAAAGLPAAATAYTLRHSVITDLIAVGKLDTMTVAILSGTSLAMIEAHYGHLLRDHAANGLALLEL